LGEFEAFLVQWLKWVAYVSGFFALFHLGNWVIRLCLLIGFVLPATVLSSRVSKCAAECSVVVVF